MTDGYELAHPYIAVQHGKNFSYGGNQNVCERKYLRQCACGVIAGNDLILYLKQHRFSSQSGEGQQLSAHSRKEKTVQTGSADAGIGIVIPGQAAYMQKVKQMNRRYFHVIPGLGMTGFGLAFGLNLYFRRHNWAVRASWGLRGDRFFERMERMLEQDIPVIMSIGPVFPNRWSRHKLPLYKKYGEAYKEVTRTNAHFVTATGIDQEWIRIASWGNTYYISRKEYTEYAGKKSTYIFSNLVMIAEVPFSE